MNYSIITAEIVCAIVMLIVGYAVFTEKRMEISHKYFAWCVVSVFAILMSDCLSYVFDGNLEHITILNTVNFLSLITGDVLIVFFGLYVRALVKEKKKNDILSNQFIVLVIIIACLDFLFEIYGFIFKKTFFIENGCFVPGPLYDVSFYVQLIVLAIILIYLIINLKVIGIKMLLIFLVYYLFPVISIIIIIINPMYSFICSSIAISFLVIYIGIEKEVESRDVIMSKLIKTDILTGIGNRYAYEEDVKRCVEETKDLNVGVIFCDLNNLKKINDEFGHEAGDKYIIKFSQILLSCFDTKDVYRISGDEFVVIIHNVENTKFDKHFDKLVEKTNIENYIASCGKSIGEIKNISNIIHEAEHNMYLEKKEYYSRSDINRRRG